MSTIPQRPPDTPLMQYYTMGKYPKPVDKAGVRKNLSTPGGAAKIYERNPQPYDDVPAKAITQTRPPLDSYDPTNYVKAQKLPLTCNVDVNTNSLHASKVNHQKNDVKRGRAEHLAIPQA